MKNKILFLTTLAILATLTSSRAADITGKVTLKGTPPPEKPIAELKTDATCSPLVKTDAPKTRFFVVGAGGELADVVVSIKDLKGRSTGVSVEPVLIDQIGCEYTPYVAAIQTGQRIKVRNSDPVLHNVHPTPTASGNEEANKVQMAKSPDLEFAFNSPEAFLRFKCDVHPWMFSYVTILDHPYFAVTGTDGAFTIKNVPPGKYTLEAAHRKGGAVTKEIEVTSANANQDFVIEIK